MNITATLTLPPGALDGVSANLIRRFEALRPKVQRFMGVQFRQCVYDSFGAAGAFRPHAWRKLTPPYARRVRRDYATLFVTGKLKNAIKLKSVPDKATVSVSKQSVPYALAHQYGNPKGNLPPRPYFPLNAGGEVTATVRALVIQAARVELQRQLMK